TQPKLHPALWSDDFLVLQCRLLLLIVRSIQMISRRFLLRTRRLGQALHSRIGRLTCRGAPCLNATTHIHSHGAVVEGSRLPTADVCVVGTLSAREPAL